MKQHKHILLYDDKGKLECTITNTGLGYQVMMLHTLLGIYQNISSKSASRGKVKELLASFG